MQQCTARAYSIAMLSYAASPLARCSTACMPACLAPHSFKRNTRLQRAADAANSEMTARLDQLLEAARAHREQSKVEWDRSQEQVFQCNANATERIATLNA